MSYTRTITSNGNSISQEGGQSFNQQLDDIQEQIKEGGGGSITDLGTSSGTANALAGASLVDTFTAGRLYRIRTNAANSGAATCSINGGTGVAMKKSPSSAALASGDIADATELLLYYDGTNLQVLAGLTVSATGNSSLLVDFASQASNGTWTNWYQLPAQALYGNLHVYCKLTRGDGKYPIKETGLAGCTDFTGASLFVDAAYIGSIYVSLRINAGWVQIYVGTGVTSTEFALGFDGSRD